MAEAATAKGAEIAVELVVDSISTQLGYIWNYKTNFENLKRQHQKLEGTWAQVQHSVDEATRNGEEIELKVVSWLDSVEKINAETTKIIEDNQRANMRCFKSLCPDLKKRYQLSKNAANKADDVSELEEGGKLLGKVSYRTPPKEPWDQFLNDYKDFESRRSIVENVLKVLSNSDVYMVGVYGMGGAGKTTLARVVGKQAEEDKVFDVVVFVEVSETPDVRNIQGAIAGKLGLELQAETETSVRANKLYEQLQKGRKNILLILDNIWKGGLEYLKKVGIPLGGDQRACKLLLTARGIDVLSTEMNCHTNFLVGDLNENDAWALFKKMAGACIEQHGLQSLAFDVANRCGGLPVAIVTVAKALKGKKEQAWRIALLELERPSSENFVGSVTAEAYSCIRLSYNQLSSDALKSIFLLCCTMEFTSNESVERLLRYGMGLDLFQTVRTMQEARDKVITLVQELKDSSLLLDTPNGEGFSIHDVVRDVGRAIAFKDHNKFTVIDDVIPREWKDKNTMKNCTSISLHGITELPNKELDCPLLHFLYMKGKNENSKIPDNFFLGMPNLRVLHLIKMELSPHPLSLRCLVNLQTLCLNCSWLRDIGFITNIKDLEILVLSCTIEQLPTEIGHLTQLRVLDLSNCYRLEIVPPSIISKLTQLEELYLDYGFDKWHVEGLNNESGNASLDELKHLSQLTTLQLCIRDHKMVPKGLFSQQLQRYKICIGSIDRWDRRNRYGTSKTLKLKSDADIVLEDGVVMQLKGIEELCIDGKQSVKNALYELDSDGFPQLKHFDIRNNPDLVYIVDSSKKWELPCDAFPLLETLSVTNLIILEKICHGQLTPNSFCRLKTVNVNGCDNLKNLFSLSIAKHLSQLQDISVSNCKNMEDIFTIGRRNDINCNEEIDRVVLDRLQSLSLSTLPKLRSFCSEEEVFASTSNEIILEDTPMPLFDGKVQLPKLKTLKLHQVNFEKIWHHQLPIMSPCFQNLTYLSVSLCHNLKHLFPSSTLGSFVQLQDLTIRECKVLEAIIRIDELGNNVEHSSLKKLDIEGCREMKAFIFNDKVSFPNLEEIRISNMINLEMIWHNQLTKDSMNAQHCQKLCKVDINSCKSLKKLFPPSIARNLFQLKDLYVIQCGIEEIVAKEGAEDAAAMTFVFPQLTSLTLVDLQELKCFYPGIHGAEDAVAMTFVFPQLTCLKLQDVQELKCFYHGIHTIEWPVLKELNLIGCDKIDHSFALELFAFQKNIPEDQLDIPVFPNLEKLSLEGNSSRMIFQSQFPEILFPKLQHLEIKNLDDQPAYLPLEIFQRSLNLESLSLKDGSNKEIFWFDEVVGKHTVTKKLSISRFENLEQIWKQDSKVDVILQNLEELHVSMCASLVTLIPPSACVQNLTILRVSFCRGLLQLVSSSTAKTLVGLKEMSIRLCDTMTKVVADDEGAITEDEIINFSKLKSLELAYLSRLTSFCSWNYTFNFPSLERLSVQNCPKMKTFTSGVVITPMLREIQLDKKVFYCEGDVNTSLLFSRERLSLSLGDIKMILQKFPEHQFSKLKSLSVSDDTHKNILEDQLDIPVFFNLEKLSLDGNSSRMIFQSQFLETLFPKLQHLEIKNRNDQPADLPLGIFQRSHDLESLSLQGGSNKEIFWFEVVGKHTLTKRLSISNFENLEQIWKQDSKVDVILQNLEELHVSRCHSLVTLIPPSACFQNLTILRVYGCSGLLQLVSSSTAKSWVGLKEMSIRFCNMMTRVVADDEGAIKEDEIISFSKLKSLDLVCVSRLTSFCSWNYTFNFPSLERLSVKNCPKMKAFTLGVVITPMLRYIRLDSKVYDCEGDANTSMQQIHEKLLFSRERLSLSPGDIKMILQKFPEHQFSKLKILAVSDDESTVFPFEMLQQSHNLEQLKLADRSYKEILLCEEVEKQAETLAQLCLKELPTMSPCFQNLTDLSIQSCNNLRYLFSFSTLRSFVQLQDLTIRECKVLEAIIRIDEVGNNVEHPPLKKLRIEKCPEMKAFIFNDKEGGEDATAMTFVFPHLTCLKLEDLQELRCFYTGIYTVEWPVLKELNLIGCDKIDQLFALELFAFQKNILEGQLDISEQPLSLVKKQVFSNLEKLKLDGNSSRMIFQSQFPEILFPKLQHLKIKNQDDQPADLPLGIFQRSHDLESLSLQGGSNKEIFWFEVVGKHTLTKRLSISDFENLEQIWKQDSKVDVILQNLEELDVSGCHSLVTLILPSACFQNLTILKVDCCRGLLQLVSSSTAKTLVGLKEMRIDDCQMMTQVVPDDEGAITEDEIINFSKLKSLELIDLPRLTSFCSWNYTFNFPSLERLSVENCPKMKAFTSGVVITPMLREIRLDNKVFYCKGDVNTSMQQIHEKLVFSGERLSLNPRDIKMILQKFTEHQISKLKSLDVFDDESIVLPFEMIQRFRSLKELKLIDCSYQEIFLCDEVEKQAETLAQLKSLYLYKLDHLEQIGKQDSKLDLILHNLETLEVHECNSLITLIPASASFQNLKSLVVRRCNGLISLLSSSTAKSLVRLEDMTIEYCNTMTELVATEDVEEENIIIFSKLTSLTLTDLSSLASFCSGSHTTLNFPSLESLYVRKCPKMKFFSSGVSSTPLLQRIRYDFNKSIWEGDLNTTIQQIHEELNPDSSTKGCVHHIE